MSGIRQGYLSIASKKGGMLVVVVVVVVSAIELVELFADIWSRKRLCIGLRCCVNRLVADTDDDDDDDE